MKKLNFFLMALALMAAISAGCGNNDPEPDPVEPTGPTFALEAGTSPTLGTEFITGSDTIFVGESFAIKLSAAQGTSPITRIEVRENGAAMEEGRIVFNGDSAQSNPSPVASETSLDWEIIIAAVGEPSTNDYEVIITDSASMTATVSFSVTTETPANQSTVVMQVLSNQSGPAGKGALDVDTGTETGVTTGNFTTADIRDMGIDSNQPNATNWLQQIKNLNGTTLKVAATGTDFDQILSLEDIALGFDRATDLGDGPSSTVEVGDIFFVRSTESIVYALFVAEVNVRPGTPGVGNGDNSDNYVFDVKGP